MSEHPLPVVGAFILNKNGQLLLVKSYKWDNGKIWSVPGGKIKIGETIEEAIKREVKEEVGVEINFVKVFAIWDAINPKEFFQKKHFIFLECQCLIKEDEVIKLDNQEIQEFAWFDLKESSKANLEYWTRRSIEVLIKEI
ncbi:hypothetical protein A2160_03415 [Candidatus Beckwithbacteria bacterium RBG_13_42_9]|uniref:Nudix hydrolase domain-containing protein n=1 Tax=Candidatus Beckwithbacteria bacterium RBG_13_42_9 TaxID=1797457 RepID=A0A1F5E8J9_9BACT|nr:MAG: hypothetical protein A2160_03415 [Candidatus Beckwithbacteria bacterium RBG_13_42_9]